jgi:hypothetical protein
MADKYSNTASTAAPDQLIQLLGNKRVQLNSPGTLLINNLYYTQQNCSVDSVECGFTVGRYTASLPSPTFGGSSQVILANNDFASQTYLYLELDNIWPGQVLSRGWGLLALASVQFLIGNTNTANLSLSGESILHVLMASAHTQEQRNEIFKLAGQESIGPIMYVNELGQAIRDPSAKHTATILLPNLPWSDICGQKLPFDTSLLNVPITLTLAFKQSNSIISGSVSPQPYALGFSKAQVIFRQGTLSNKGNSLKQLLMEVPDARLHYPMQYSTTYTPPAFYGSRSLNSPVTVPLLGFINADLLGITFHVVRTTLLQSNAALNLPANGFQTDNITEIRLLYNGLTFFYMPGDSHKLICMDSNASGQYWHNSLIQHAGAGAYTSVGQDSYFVHLSFARLRGLVFQDIMQNVPRYGSNTMSLQFLTEGGADVKYQMYCTYHYNGVVDCVNGTSEVYF